MSIVANFVILSTVYCCNVSIEITSETINDLSEINKAKTIVSTSKRYFTLKKQQTGSQTCLTIESLSDCERYQLLQIDFLNGGSRGKS